MNRTMFGEGDLRSRAGRATNNSRKPIPLNSDSLEGEIVCSDNRPRMEPGEYRAYCRCAKRYFDKTFGRWVVMLSFDILGENLVDVIARRVPMFFSLGDGKSPKPSRRRLFYYVWCLANGAPPARSDRMSVNIFLGRMARVLVRDTKRCVQDAKRAVAPYSVIESVLEWETGAFGVHLINGSTDQVRHGLTSAGAPTCKQSMSKDKPLILVGDEGKQSALARVGYHNTTQGDDRGNPSAVQRHDAAPGLSKATSLPAANGAALKYGAEP